MKKQLISLFTFTFLLGGISFAQLTSPHFISVNFGTNMPIGNFQEVDSIASSGANTGIYYSFEAGAYFSKFFGVALNVGAFSNSVDEESIKDQLKNNLGSSDEFSVNSDNWVNGYIMLGPIFSVEVSKVIIDAKILGGIMNTEKPFINVESTSAGTTTSFNKSNQVTASAFGLNYGLHLRIKLKSKLGLRLNAEGFMSTQEFETEVIETSLDGTTTTTTTEKLEKDIEALNLGIGLIITL